MTDNQKHVPEAVAVSHAKKVEANHTVGKQSDNPHVTRPIGHEPVDAKDAVEDRIYYLCPRAPEILLKLSETEYVQAANGVLELSVMQVDLLEALMKNRPDIRQLVSKVDMITAREMVEKHKAERLAAARQGPLASNDPAADKLREAKQAQDRDHLTREKKS